MAGLIYKELWHDPKTCEWTKRYSSDVGWLWVKLLSFVDDHATKGVITVTQALTVATLNHIPPIAVNQLVEARGLDVVAGGYRIHNYLKRDRLSKIRRGAGKKGYTAMVGSLPGNLPATVAEKGAAESAVSFAGQNYGVGVGVVERIYDKWSGSVGRVVRLTPGRRKAILARLKDGFIEADLLDAATGWQNDPWPDRLQHNDLTILFRNGEQVEKFRDLQRHPPVKPPANTRSGKAIAAGRAWGAIADQLPQQASA